MLVTTANTNRAMPMMPASTAYTGSYSIQCFFKFFLELLNQRFSHSLYGCIFNLYHTLSPLPSSVSRFLGISF